MMQIIKFIHNKKSYIAEYKNQSVNPINLESNKIKCFQDIELYDGIPIEIEDLEIKPIIQKNKTVFAIAENYNSSKEIIFFYKGRSDEALIMKNNLSIKISKKISNLWAEVELGFVVAKDISFDSKNIIDESFILGHFLANDITATYQEEDHHLLFSKASKGFLQIGKILDLNFNAKNKEIKLTQDSNELRRGIVSERRLNDIQILSLLRNQIDIKAGDSILTGAPSRCRQRIYLADKNNIELSIEDLESVSYNLLLQRF